MGKSAPGHKAVTYASNTIVSPEKTRGHIERELKRYGATSFAYGTEIGRAYIGFQTKDRRVKFILPLIPATRGTPKQFDQFYRSRWRALLLSIKAKLEAVESGIETFDEAFMPHIVMPNGKTMAEYSLPYIREAYSTGKMPPLLSFQ
jgi:hypothetical protein